MAFKKMFSVPRTPNTSFSPGQAFSLLVPRGMKAIVTDIYIENLGGGFSVFQISEKTGTNTYEIRYSFRTPDNDRTVLNFTTGLRLGEQKYIREIRFENTSFSNASILPRVNGIFTCSH